MSMKREDVNDQISLKLLEILDVAHMYQISNFDIIEYSCNPEDELVNFDPKTELEHLFTECTESSGTLLVHIKTHGLLSQTLKKHGVSEDFIVTFIDEDFRGSAYLDEKEFLQKLMLSCEYEPTIKNEAAQEALLADLSKLQLLQKATLA